MGRYDKIKVYNGTEFVTPSRVRVYDGEVWQDLGTADSDFKKSMYVRHEEANHRITLNRQEVEVEGYSYRDGAFSATPTNGFNFCPASTSSGGATFLFEAYIKRAKAGEIQIMKLGTSNEANNYFSLTLNADNTITMRTSCIYKSPYRETKTTTAKINPDDWNYVKATASKGSYNISVNINGVNQTWNNIARSYLSQKANNSIGNTGLYIRGDGFNLKGCGYDTDGSPPAYSYSTVPVNNTETYTEVNWI